MNIKLKLLPLPQNFKLTTLTLFAFVSLFQVYAGTDSSYYPDSFLVKLKDRDFNNESLKEKLHLILTSNHLRRANKQDLLKPICRQRDCYRQATNINYKQARQILFGHLFIEKSDSRGFIVKDRYCNEYYGQEDGVNPKSIPDPRKINCEHSWPQSKFSKKFSKRLQKTDLHHLYPVKSRVNSVRSNKPFSEVKNTKGIDHCPDSASGKSVYNSKTAFAPPYQHRGDLARAMFYFSVRYKMRIDESQEFFFKKWHREDPVDDAERWRNNEIYRIQKNRNPFIDRPELIDRIDDF